MMIQNKKHCIACKRKIGKSDLDLVEIRQVSFRMFCCKDKNKCLHYQLNKNKKNER